VAFYLDGCRIHSTLAVRAWALECAIPLLRGVPYQPQFSGIENFWSQSKNLFRQIGTKTILSGQQRDLTREALQSIDAQSNQFAKNCYEGGIKAIMHIFMPGDGEDEE